jgi:Protein of unknown function (DUF3592)
VSETLSRTEMRTVGIVTDHASRRSHGDTDYRTTLLFFPSVRFQTQDGKTMEFENKIGSNAPPKVGDQVTVIYDPARPEEAKVALGSIFKIDPKALLVVGGIFLAAMAFFFLFFVAMIVWVSLS